MRIQTKTFWQNKDARDTVQFDDMRPAVAYQASSPLNGARRAALADELGNGVDDSRRSIRCDARSGSFATLARSSCVRYCPISDNFLHRRER